MCAGAESGLVLLEADEAVSARVFEKQQGEGVSLGTGRELVEDPFEVSLARPRCRHLEQPEKAERRNRLVASLRGQAPPEYARGTLHRGTVGREAVTRQRQSRKT